MKDSKLERCVWKPILIVVPKCRNCDGYNIACNDYASYNTMKEEEDILEKYNDILRREK
jgi:hypothetical protein